jgi:hypothetical protein
MDTKHTPGPWTVQELITHANYPKWTSYSIHDGITNVHIATVGHMDRYFEEQTGDHARIIAAAPDMLEALKRIADGQWDHTIAETSGTLAMREIARAAIAKATGAA